MSEQRQDDNGHNHDHDHHDHDHDHDHEHNHDHDQEDAVFVLTDDEGVEHEMVMVYQFESGDQGYAVLLNRNDPEADGIIFRIEEENGEAYLVNIEEDEEWQRVVNIYNQIIEEDSK